MCSGLGLVSWPWCWLVGAGVLMFAPLATYAQQTGLTAADPNLSDPSADTGTTASTTSSNVQDKDLVQEITNYTNELLATICSTQPKPWVGQGRRYYCGERQPQWVVVMDYMQLLLTSLGFAVNIVTFITLLRMDKDIRPTTLFLLQHLSFADSMVCLLSAIMHASPDMFHVGNRHIDQIICHVWHSQIIYWWFINVSTATIVFIAVDRYLAVCLPHKHQFFTPRKCKIWLAISYIICFINLIPTSLQISLKNDKCVYETVVDNNAIMAFYTFYSVYVWIVVYFLPCTILATLYGKLICTFKKKRKNATLSLKDKYHDVANNLTVTAILVTSCLLVTLSYDVNYYMLAYMKVTTYEMASPQQKIGTLLATINSCVNPLIYAAFMPVYRGKIVETIRCCLCRGEQTQPDSPRASSGPAEAGSMKLHTDSEMV